MCCLSLHSSLICFFSIFWHCQAGNSEPERMESDGEQSLVFFQAHVHGVIGGGWLGTQSTMNQPSSNHFLFDRKKNRQVNHAHESGAAPLCLSCPMHGSWIYCDILINLHCYKSWWSACCWHAAVQAFPSALPLALHKTFFSLFLCWNMGGLPYVKLTFNSFPQGHVY